MPFTSSHSTHRQCFNVTIIDDRILEDNETFSLRLSQAGNSSVPVIIHPNVSTIKIVDDDCKLKICMISYPVVVAVK